MTADGNKPPEKKDLYAIWSPGGSSHGRQADRPAGRGSGISPRASLSGREMEIRELVDAVRAIPDVRHEKVAAIKMAIESGTYVVDAGKIAQKMIEEIR